MSSFRELCTYNKQQSVVVISLRLAELCDCSFCHSVCLWAG